MTDTPAQTGERRVYLLQPRSERIGRPIIGGCFLLFVLFWIGWLGSVLFWPLPSVWDFATLVSYAMFLIPVIFFGGVGIIMLRSGNGQLVLSSYGIELDTGGYRLATTWENVERIGVMYGYEVLLLRQPVEVGGPLAWCARLWPGAGHFIPLLNFGQHWGDSELAQGLRHFAPHLFDADGTPRRPGAG